MVITVPRIHLQDPIKLFSGFVIKAIVTLLGFHIGKMDQDARTAQGALLSQEKQI